MGHYLNPGIKTIDASFTLEKCRFVPGNIPMPGSGTVQFFLTFPDKSVLELKSLVENTVPPNPPSPDSDLLGDRIPYYWFNVNGTIILTIEDIMSGLAYYPDSYTKNGVRIPFSYTYFPDGIYTVAFMYNSVTEQQKYVLNQTPVLEGIKYLLNELLESEEHEDCVLELPAEFNPKVDKLCFITMIKDLVIYLYDSFRYEEATKHSKTLYNLLSGIPYDEINT